MTLRHAIRHPFYNGSGVSTLVPYKWDCAVNGRTFMFEDKYFGTAQFTRSSIPMLRPPTETGTISEQSLNPGDGIRVGINSWHHGAGQTYLDAEDSDPFRFRSSKGIDPWTKGKLSLLPDTERKRTDNIYFQAGLAVAGSRLYSAGGGGGTNGLVYTTDILATTPTWTAVTGVPANVFSVATDGYTVWIGCSTDGIYETNTATGAASSRATGTVNGPLGYVKGRLMAAHTNSIYNITSLTGAAAPLPAALYSHPNTAFRWVGFAEGQNVIYAAGYAGDKSVIYKTTIKADGTALDVPTVAGELPDGEIVRSISSYLGLVLIGTSKGWWTASQDSNGNLEVNKVQDVRQGWNSPGVYCFEGQGDFVWYGWSYFDIDSGGLGRADLRSDTKGASVVTPAYASDLMGTVAGLADNLLTSSVVTFQGVRVFVLSGPGVVGGGIYAEKATAAAILAAGTASSVSGGGTTSGGTSTPGATRVASGTIESGWITHRMADQKVAVSVGAVHEPLDGTVTIELSTDGTTFTTLATSSEADSTRLTAGAGSVVSERFELRNTFTRDTTDTTVGPVLTRSTMESNPAPGRGERFTVALKFREKIAVGNSDEDFDCPGSYRFLVDLESAGVPIVYQDVLGSETVVLDDHDFLIAGHTPNRDGFRGDYLLTMRRSRRRV